jgi:hypothetical protein
MRMRSNLANNSKPPFNGGKVGARAAQPKVGVKVDFDAQEPFGIGSKALKMLE